MQQIKPFLQASNHQFYGMAPIKQLHQCLIEGIVYVCDTLPTHLYVHKAYGLNEFWWIQEGYKIQPSRMRLLYVLNNQKSNIRFFFHDYGIK